MNTLHDTAHEAGGRNMAELELALLRRGLNQRDAGRECCSRCRRTPLVGERVYLHDHGSIVCELCCSLDGAVPRDSRLVHGPAFGHSIRIVDQRAA
jgi:hypothetical protein